MKIWIVNPFDPLPGEREQLGRYAHLASALREAGHEVLWWSSTFWHRFKREVDRDLVTAGAKEWGIDIRLVPTPPYTKNVSIRRLRSHRAFGRAFQRLARDRPRPDIILASSPPLESACEAARLGEDWGVPTVIDIQDQWPDNFVRVMPPALRWLSGLLLRSYYALEREACSRATGIVGVGQGYVDRGVHVGGRKKYEGMFPLGVSLKEVGEAIQEGTAQYGDKWTKPQDQIWVLYSGSLSYNYDFLTIVRAAIPIREKYGDGVRFILTGRGELSGEAEEIIRQHNLDNVTMTGFLDFGEWACILSQTDAGFNASFPDALIYFPNKIFYYLAAGAAVLNTIPGQCAELVDKQGCGLNYTAGDPQSCFEAISQLVESPEKLASMGHESRRLAEEVYDRSIVYTDMTRFLEKIVADNEARP